MVEKKYAAKMPVVKKDDITGKNEFNALPQIVSNNALSAPDSSIFI
jgi:hypothetical protein